MTKIILPFITIGFLALAACAPSDKTVFDPNDVGQDVDTKRDQAPPIQNEQPVTKVEPFPEDAKKFNRAWTRTDTSILIDCYQGSSINWDKLSTDKRVAGVIHRATIGLRADTLFASRRDIANRKGLLWGAYHLGKSGDPLTQAEFFLKTLGDSKNVLMILDLENTSDGSMMNVANAKLFMAYIYQQTGRVPVVYANHSVTKALNTAVKNDPNFKSSRLWYARYLSAIPDFPKGNWNTYFLWQFSSYLNCSKTGSCLYNVPGTDRYIDVNVFYGSREALQYQWTL